MSGLYAKTKASVQVLFAFAFILMLSGCAGGGMSGMSMPWGTNAGVVTTDKDSMPDIGWQTQGDRRELAAQNQDFKQQAAATPLPKVRVALLLPLSGKNGDLGQSMLKAAQMAMFDVGSANFELVPRDTKSTPEGAANAAQTAVNNHEALILGPIFAEDLRMVRPIAQSANIPVISFSTDWKQAGGDTYIMGFMPFAQVSRVAQYAQAKGYDHIGVFAPQTEYCDVVLSSLQRAGVNVVKVGRYSPQQSDLSQIVTDFAATSKQESGEYQFNALMLPVGGEGLRSLMSVFAQNGVHTKNLRLLGTGLWDDPSLTRDPAVFGGWFAAPDPTLRRDFERRYSENYGGAPPRLASLAYDATALSAVLARIGNPGQVYSRGALTNARGFAGIDGVFRFRSDGLTERGLAVLEIQSGRDVVIDPAPTAFISSGS
ncbi:MAG: penicillin-binding protein activator [Alphaproteobacteria bacterium]